MVDEEVVAHNLRDAYADPRNDPFGVRGITPAALIRTPSDITMISPSDADYPAHIFSGIIIMGVFPCSMRARIDNDISSV
ncbi:MAG: hypothetical protein IKH39_01395 [Candidatus Methanomethylophilaceae archaeon]|nr:hypothetical protein [Candidatus Methanomethylophilaceae archaeon]MBR4181189.1 hypothetical protein [Candidatus Methanomethylophilaceae archaeon]